MPALDTDYWLGHCHGFCVDSPGKRIGRVEDVLFKTRVERPDTLLIRTGILRTHLVAVPVEDVEEINPRNAHIELRHLPR